MLTYDGSMPSTPTALQDHFITEVFKPAMRNSVLAQFCKKIRVNGASMNIPSYSKLGVKSSIDRANEQSNFTQSELSLDGKKVDMQLRGHAMVISETMSERNVGVYDIININRDELRQEMKTQIEKIVKQAMDNTPLDYVASGLTSASVTTSGTPTASALYNLNVYHAQRLSLLGADTYAIPKISSFGKYAAVFRGEAFLSLRNDSRWEGYYEGVPEGLKGLVVGEIADLRLFHHDDEEVLSNSIGTNSDVSEGLIFGQDSCWFGMIKPFQFYEDFGQTAANLYGTKRHLWYKADVAADIPSDSANKRRVRVIHWTSA